MYNPHRSSPDTTSRSISPRCRTNTTHCSRSRSSSSHSCFLVHNSPCYEGLETRRQCSPPRCPSGSRLFLADKFRIVRAPECQESALARDKAGNCPCSSSGICGDLQNARRSTPLPSDKFETGLPGASHSGNNRRSCRGTKGNPTRDGSRQTGWCRWTLGMVDSTAGCCRDRCQPDSRTGTSMD